MKGMRYVGMDVHAETIAIAVVGEDGTEREVVTVANRPESIRKYMKKLGRPEALRCCYEAGPTGYVLYWQLLQMGIECTVVAPTLIPTKAGDRVKTERRDARKLARYLRSGDLTAVWVPDEAHEALRDLVRARQAAKIDEKRARNRLQKFLLRHGQRPPRTVRAWTARHRAWLEGLKLGQATLQVVLEEYLHEVRHGEQRVDQQPVEKLPLSASGPFPPDSASRHPQQSQRFASGFAPGSDEKLLALAHAGVSQRTARPLLRDGIA